MRASALLLAASLCSQCGADWTLVTGNSQLFRLLATLASLVLTLLIQCEVKWCVCIQEMRLCLEGREGLESLQSDLLCSCCIILESSVTFTAVQTSSCSGEALALLTHVFLLSNSLNLRFFARLFYLAPNFVNTIAGEYTMIFTCSSDGRRYITAAFCLH